MKSWQDIKDLSYVSIKRTKAKCISEGLSKCKIDNCTKQNPIYEHIKFHKLLQKKKIPYCKVCSQQSLKNSTITTKQKQNSQSQLPSHKRKQQFLTLNKQIKRKSLFTKIRPVKSSFFYQVKLTSNQKQHQVFTQNLKKFNNALTKFNNSLKISKSNLQKIETKGALIKDHFDLQMKAIQYQIDEDKGINIHELIHDQKNIQQEIMKDKKKLKERKNRVAKINQPVIYPLSDSQTKIIVQYQAKHINKQKQKLIRILSNLYEYKSKLNYKNKKSIIHQYKKN